MLTSRFTKWMGAALIVGMLTVVGVPTVFAATSERPGYSPASAAAPDNALHELQPGQWDWYVFHTQSVNYSADTAQTASIDVTMNAVQGQGNFQIWGAQNLDQWTGGVKVTPIGQGTENASIHSDPLHYWAGSFTVNGNFYIVVQNKSNQTLDYSLTISSNNVDFPSQLSVQSVVSAQ